MSYGEIPVGHNYTVYLIFKKETSQLEKRWRKRRFCETGSFNLYLFSFDTIIMFAKRQTQNQFQCRDIHGVLECFYTLVRHVVLGAAKL